MTGLVNHPAGRYRVERIGRLQARGLAFDGWRPATCQWIDGDPRHDGGGKCGASVVTGKPYCADHCARAYRKPDEAEGAE